jgi:hypothetical protein
MSGEAVKPNGRAGVASVIECFTHRPQIDNDSGSSSKNLVSHRSARHLECIKRYLSASLPSVIGNVLERSVDEILR